MRRLFLHVCILAVVVGLPSKAATRRINSEIIAQKLDELQTLGFTIDPEELLESLTQLSNGKFLCNGLQSHNTDMKKVMLSNNASTTCNDGSDSGLVFKFLFLYSKNENYDR